MTPVTKSVALKSYPFKRLEKDVVAALLKHADVDIQGSIALRINSVIILLECFCDIKSKNYFS